MLAPTVLTHLEGIVGWQDTAATFDRTDAGPIAAVYDVGRDKVDAMGMMGWKGLCGGLVEDVKGIILAHRQSSQSTPPNRRRDLHFGGVSILRQTKSGDPDSHEHFLGKWLDLKANTVRLWGIMEDTELLKRSKYYDTTCKWKWGRPSSMHVKET